MPYARYGHDHPTPLKSTLAFEDPRQEDGELYFGRSRDERTLNTLEQSLGSLSMPVRSSCSKDQCQRWWHTKSWMVATMGRAKHT